MNYLISCIIITLGISTYAFAEQPPLKMSRLTTESDILCIRPGARTISGRTLRKDVLIPYQMFIRSLSDGLIYSPEKLEDKMEIPYWIYQIDPFAKDYRGTRKWL